MGPFGHNSDLIDPVDEIIDRLLRFTGQFKGKINGLPGELVDWTPLKRRSGFGGSRKENRRHASLRAPAAGQARGFQIQRVAGNPIQERVFGLVSPNCPCRNPFSLDGWTPAICQEIEADHRGAPEGGEILA